MLTGFRFAHRWWHPTTASTALVGPLTAREGVRLVAGFVGETPPYP